MTCNKSMQRQLDYGHAKLTTESRRRGDKGNENTESGHTQYIDCYFIPILGIGKSIDWNRDAERNKRGMKGKREMARWAWR